MRSPVHKHSRRVNRHAVHVCKKKRRDRGYEKHKGRNV